MPVPSPPPHQEPMPRNANELKKYLFEAAIQRKKDAQRLLSEVKELPIPDLRLPEPRIVRGEFAYMLLPDDANDVSESVLESRVKQPFDKLVAQLKESKPPITLLEEWPADYERGRP